MENDRSADADVGWYVNNFAYNAVEISGLLISTMVFAYIILFLTNNKKVASNALRKSA